jgi:hypothetical protein
MRTKRQQVLAAKACDAPKETEHCFIRSNSLHRIKFSARTNERQTRTGHPAFAFVYHGVFSSCDQSCR